MELGLTLVPEIYRTRVAQSKDGWVEIGLYSRICHGKRNVDQILVMQERKLSWSNFDFCSS